MKEVFQAVSNQEEKLMDMLNLELADLRNEMIKMFKSASVDKAERRKQRKIMVFLLERLQDLEKDKEPPYGRQQYQMLIDEGMKVLDEDIRKLATSQNDKSRSEYSIEEVFTSRAKLDGISTDKRISAKNAVPQSELQETVVEHGFDPKGGGIILPSNLLNNVN